MKTVLNLDVLKTMSAEELEDYRAAGEDFRRELSHAVMRELVWLRCSNAPLSLVYGEYPLYVRRYRTGDALV